MITNCNGGMAEHFIQEYIVGPMWTANCYDENDLLPVATLIHFLWPQAGEGGTELEHNLNMLVNRPEALVTRLQAGLGNSHRPRFWYETFEKRLEHVVEQMTLSRNSMFGTNTDEWSRQCSITQLKGLAFSET